MRRILPVKRRERGAELVEFALVLIPLFFFIFAIFSISWILFAQGSLQYAAREGCRYAVTGSNPSSPATLALVQQVVQQHSFGFIPPTELYDVTVTGPSSSGVFTVTATKKVKIIGGAFFGTNYITLSASSSDALENPSGQ